MKPRRKSAPKTSPKRILSLDGGGVRGIVSLAFLERIEADLQPQAGGSRPLRLCDHFDLIGGTSTGAIIATGLALGMSVSEMIRVYLDLSHKAFRGTRWHGGFVAPKFRTRPMMEVLRRFVGDERLGSEKLRTGLAVVAKRIDTGSPWVFHNNPNSKYFDAPEDDPAAIPNKDMRLLDILRASTAAPTYFSPETILVAERVSGLFVDGGVSPYNNPSLLLLVMATTAGYGYGWPTGAENLALVSIGTGAFNRVRDPAEFRRKPSAYLAAQALHSLILDCSWQAQAILQWLGRTEAGVTIDAEMGSLAEEKPTPSPLLAYRRHDIVLEREWLAAELGLRVSERELAQLRAMDRPETVDRLYEISRTAARRLPIGAIL